MQIVHLVKKANTKMKLGKSLANPAMLVNGLALVGLPLVRIIVLKASAALVMEQNNLAPAVIIVRREPEIAVLITHVLKELILRVVLQIAQTAVQVNGVMPEENLIVLTRALKAIIAQEMVKR